MGLLGFNTAILYRTAIYIFLSFQTIVSEQICEGFCDHCSQSVCFADAEKLSNHNVCEIEASRLTVNTTDSAQGILNITSTAGVCTVDFDIEANSWIKIMTSDDHTNLLFEDGIGSTCNYSVEIDKCHSCPKNISGSLTIVSARNDSTGCPIDLENTDDSQQDIGYVLFTGQSSDQISMDITKTDNESFQLFFKVCKQVPIGDHSVISTVKQTGCYIVSRSMYSSDSPHRSLSWSLNISSITENSVIVLQQYKKPKVTKSSHNNETCRSEDDKLICDMGRFDKSPIYLTNRNHKSAFLNFSYASNLMKPSEIPIDFEVLPVPCNFSNFPESAVMEAISDTTFNIICPTNFYLKKKSKSDFEPPNTEAVCNYETEEWSVPPYDCIEAVPIYNNSNKVKYIESNETGKLVSHNTYPSQLPTQTINSSIVLTGLTLGKTLAIEFISFDLISSTKSHSESCSQYLRLQGVRSTAEEAATIFCSALDFGSSRNEYFEVLNSNVTFTFISNDMTSGQYRGFFIVYNITDKPIPSMSIISSTERVESSTKKATFITLIVVIVVLLTVCIVGAVIYKLKRGCGSQPKLLGISSQNLTHQHSQSTHGSVGYRFDDVYYEIGDLGPDPAHDGSDDAHYYTDIDKRKLPELPGQSEESNKNEITVSVVPVADEQDELMCKEVEGTHTEDRKSVNEDENLLQEVINNSSLDMSSDSEVKNSDDNGVYFAAAEVGVYVKGHQKGASDEQIRSQNQNELIELTPPDTKNPESGYVTCISGYRDVETVRSDDGDTPDHTNMMQPENENPSGIYVTNSDLANVEGGTCDIGICKDDNSIELVDEPLANTVYITNSELASESDEPSSQYGSHNSEVKNSKYASNASNQVKCNHDSGIYVSDCILSNAEIEDGGARSDSQLNSLSEESNEGVLFDKEDKEDHGSTGVYVTNSELADTAAYPVTDGSSSQVETSTYANQPMMDAITKIDTMVDNDLYQASC